MRVITPSVCYNMTDIFPKKRNLWEIILEMFYFHAQYFCLQYWSNTILKISFFFFSDFFFFLIHPNSLVHHSFWQFPPPGEIRSWWRKPEEVISTYIIRDIFFISLLSYVFFFVCLFCHSSGPLSFKKKITHKQKTSN